MILNALQGPGFGKTTALAVGTLAMQASLGNILCSGPCNVSVDNFASRLDSVTSTVCKRYNDGKSQDDLARIRHKLVVRAYKPRDEYDAFMDLVQNPSHGDKAAPNRGWSGPSVWRQHLSLAFWLLVLLRSPGVRGLHDDDSEALHQMRRAIDSLTDLESLRAVATAQITWEAYQQAGIIHEDKIQALMKNILQVTDLLCTTPAMTAKYKEYLTWKSTAEGIAVDEAASMNRADLACVWGNTLLPCLLSGDPKQLPPTMITGDEKDNLGNFINRFVADGKISGLLFLEGAGIPVYRLHVQLRMADGLFDAISQEIYPEVPLKYASSCAIDLPQYASGRALEDYIKERHQVTPPPAGKLSPLFIHCEGSRVFADELTGSKRSPDQVKIALDFIVDFVNAKKVDPTSIVILAPYAANVELIRRMRKRPEYVAISAMEPTSTVEGSRGKEGDIAVVVMSTAAPRPGPGFTSGEQRLNVMLTRQRCRCYNAPC
jgi:hypothetical protein